MGSLRGRDLLAVAIVLSSFCALSQTQVPRNVTMQSGSGSGSGSDQAAAARNCSDLSCSHSCMERATGPECYCPIGYILAQDMMTCQACPGGLYGMGCSQQCNCSSGGNTCDRISGTCMCNPCYTGTRCENGTSYDCFVQFLGIGDKSYNSLRERYGLLGYPRPPDTYLARLVVTGIMELTDLSLISNVQLETVNRTSVRQGPLVKLTWSVNKDRDRPQADRALSDLSNKVKLGNIRATYIAQDSTDTTLVTLNAGIKEDPL